MSEQIKSMTAITEVFPDGQRVTGAAIEYGELIHNADVCPDAFQVKGGTVTGAYTNTEARPTDEPKDGRFVIVKLSLDDEDSKTVIRAKPKHGPGGPGGPVGGDHPLICLEQGNGAVNFASERDQQKHPSFVLGIQYGLEGPLTRDDFTVNEEGIQQIVGVLNHVLDTYSIDRNRIYTTGQSMGCMTSCELNVRYPDLFAASLLVAGQWDPEKMGKLYRNSYWILVSEHDAKAFPGMNAVTEAMEKNGGKVGRYYWNAKAGKDVLNRAVEQAAGEDYHLRYTAFEGDMVVPDGETPNARTNHMCTWPVVYSIDALRDWLFTQTKEG